MKMFLSRSPCAFLRSIQTQHLSSWLSRRNILVLILLKTLCDRKLASILRIVLSQCSHVPLAVLRRTISSSITDSGLWTPGTESVCYEALEHARELCQQWYEDRLSDTAALGIQREEEAQVRQEHQQQQQRLEELSIQEAPAADDEDGLEGFDVDGVQWTICEPILDRKSVFIAHAAPLDDPKHVKPMLRSLKKDKKIAKATHNIVAWRCRVNVSIFPCLS